MPGNADYEAPQHRTHVERTTNRAGEAIFYAWCSHQDCYWHSPHRREQLTVEEFARKHERNARPIGREDHDDA